MNQAMNKRPLSITLISSLFIAIGVVALTYHSIHPSEDHIMWIFFVRFLALLCGVSMLLRQNWARWLIALWLAYHVFLSVYHAVSEVIIHGLLFAVIVFFLFRPSSNAYFRAANNRSSQA
jgi:hypothetical protein